MCHLRNIALHDYQESVTTGQTDTRTDKTDGWTDRQTPDKVIPMCRYASQATQKNACCLSNLSRGSVTSKFMVWDQNIAKWITLYLVYIQNKSCQKTLTLARRQPLLDSSQD